MKRAHRLGQEDRVFVKRFFCTGTVEERILQKLREKRRLFSEVFDDDRPSDDAMGLDPDEVFELFENLKVRPKKAKDEPKPYSVVLDNLDGRQFERLVRRLYEKQGYHATVVGQSGDGGIDINAVRFTGPAQEFVVIQCKRQVGPVGPDKVRELWGVVNADPVITRGDFVTSSRFTRSAQEFAADKRLTLVDRAQLELLLKEHGVAVAGEGVVEGD